MLQKFLDQSPNHDEVVDIDWENLGFGLMPTDYMYTMKCGKDEQFKQGQLSRYGNIELSPSAGVLNYGQGLFEGTKAYRREDGGIFLFRPQENAIRMQIGAERMCMPSPSIHQFVDAVKETALSNRRWIPPAGKGSLYIRPLLIGSGAVLGLAPSPEYSFLVYASPVGNYFKEGTAPLKLYVEDEFHRATRGGAGGVKSITNYAPVLRAIRRARDRGFSDVLYLNSVNKRDIEEVSSCNVFMVKDNTLSTPATSGTILEGVTRKSIMDVASDLGYQVEERPITIEELLEADEVFCTGTAVGVAPVGSITYKGNMIEYKGKDELVCRKLYSRLVGIQKGIVEDKRGWIVEID
ncbi:branched-chain-amino-acid aminotransferase 2, chloroplastic isoform X2 [Henckelia pumila]|uniref:branched-chain-amino-acid aminotransferase 2, chloroplastic isoform X2 n=1 Tax=Henckelia pumila TaxID=405737 RepID=UPI003C6DF6D9